MTGPFTLLSPLFGDPAIDACFDDRAHLQGMLDFEAALARAESRAGMIPDEAASAIGAACKADLYDPGAIATAAARSGNTAIPLVKALTAQVAQNDSDAARWVHWGATSQDALDTGLVLQCRSALAVLLEQWGRLEGALAALAERHAATPQIGRTWMQHAVPISFGLKAATWLSQAMRVGDRLREVSASVTVLQFGGAAGTLASLGDQGLVVAELLARELDLDLPDIPWHGQRDRLCEVAGALGLAAGTLGKIARDISLLGQTEIGEVAEAAEPGKGGSSTMPHKRNPVGCAVALAASQRVPPLVATMLAAQTGEHERSLGPWQAEWETLPEIFRLVGGSLRNMVEATAHLDVHPERMTENINATKGLVLAEAVTMALGQRIGRARAHELVEQASHRAIAQSQPLIEVLSAEPEVTRHLDGSDLHQIMDPAGYLGQSGQFTQRVLASWRTRPSLKRK
jgi:3-carboxy-cis,cis-muconate cycloisomerase